MPELYCVRSRSRGIGCRGRSRDAAAWPGAGVGLSAQRLGGDSGGHRRSARAGRRRRGDGAAADRPADHRPPPAPRCAVGVLRRRDQRRRAGGQRLRHGLRPRQGTDAARRAAVSAVRRGDEPRADRRRRLCLPVFLGADVAHLLGAGGGPSHRPGKPARRPPLSGDGGDRHDGAAVRLRRPRRPGGRLRLRHHPRPCTGAGGCRPGAGRRLDRLRLERRPHSAARLVAARPSCGAEPRLGADERRHDQGRDLRLRAHRLRPAGPAGLVVGACRRSCWGR